MTAVRQADCRAVTAFNDPDLHVADLRSANHQVDRVDDPGAETVLLAAATGLATPIRSDVPDAFRLDAGLKHA